MKSLFLFAIVCAALNCVGPLHAQRAQTELERCGEACKKAGMVCLLGVMSDPGPGADPGSASQCRSCRSLLCDSRPSAPAPPPAQPKIEPPVLTSPCGTKTDEASLTVSWTPGKRITDYQLKVRSSRGETIIGPMKATSTGIDSIPPGETIYLTLVGYTDEGTEVLHACQFESIGEAGVALAMRVYPAIFITGAPYRAIRESPTPDSCRAACQGDPKCKSYTYYRPEYTQDRMPACELKSSAASYTQNACCISGMKQPVQPPPPPAQPPPPQAPGRRSIFEEMLAQRDSLRFQPGINLAGGDYNGFEMRDADPGACQAACRNDRQCRAFTYVRPGVEGQFARCFLKSTVPAPAQNACCTSGIK